MQYMIILTGQQTNAAELHQKEKHQNLFILVNAVHVMYSFAIESGPSNFVRRPRRDIVVIETVDDYPANEVEEDEPLPQQKIVIQETPPAPPRVGELINQLTVHETQVQNERNKFRRHVIQNITRLKQYWSAMYPNTDYVQTNYMLLGANIGEHEIPSGIPAIEWHPLYIECTSADMNNNASFRLVPPPGRVIIPPCRDQEDNGLIPIVIALKESKGKTLFLMTVYVVRDQPGFRISETDVFKTKTSEGVKTNLSVYEQSISSIDQTVPSRIIQKSIIAIKLISLIFTINEIDSVLMPPSWPVLFFESDREMLDIYSQYLHTVHASTNILPQSSTIYASNVAMILSSSDTAQKPGYFQKSLGPKESCIVS